MPTLSRFAAEPRCCADKKPSARIVDCARMKSTSARNRRSCITPRAVFGVNQNRVFCADALLIRTENAVGARERASPRVACDGIQDAVYSSSPDHQPQFEAMGQELVPRIGADAVIQLAAQLGRKLQRKMVVAARVHVLRDKSVMRRLAFAEFPGPAH